MDLALRQNIQKSLTCPICHKLFRRVTTIDECCHRFCNKCIIKKISEEGFGSCPVCDVDLGCAPLQRLRIDYRWQSILDRFNGRKREHTERGVVKQRTKMSEVSGQESKGSDVDSSKQIHNQTKERATDTLSNSLIPEASLSTRVKQEIDVDNEGKSLEKMREMCRHSANTSTLRRTRELRARRREEDNSNIVRGLKNETNVGIKEKVETFWFSLVASNNQTSKAPLEQIPSRYLRLKDGNITVSSIKKYLMQKLNLRSENEVEISLQGRLLLPNLQIRKLVDMWLHTSAAAERKTAFVGSSAHDFVLILTYAKRPQSAST